MSSVASTECSGPGPLERRGRHYPLVLWRTRAVRCGALALASPFAVQCGKPILSHLVGMPVLEWRVRISTFGVSELGACCGALSDEFLVGEPTHDPRMLHVIRKNELPILDMKR